MALAFASCTLPGSVVASPAAVTTRDPGEVQCPDGTSARPGLQNFGAYIGTWQENRPHDTKVPTDYIIGTVPGRVVVRCSTDGFIVLEQIHPLFAAPAGQALRVALTEIPDDSEKVYDHVHAGCRVLQYQSQKLAQQLGADDTDGRVGIVFEGGGGAYSGTVKTIILDLFDKLGADTRGC
ncbi:MAG TPA: hypothetical protein VJR46_05155 [Candidatus Dormibacteraeota bacterium]|nr:hypothetical protein [Candidatus Dormibacteraeota bacterium]